MPARRPTPPGPVVGGVVAPVVDPGRDVSLLEQGIHLSGTVEQFILPRALSYAHNDAVAVFLPIGMVGRHLAQEVVGRVVVDERVLIVGEEVACIVESAQCQQI